MANIAVVGAGVMGLSSAVAIQRALPNARVTIMADKFTTDTTSDGAGGLFVPYAVDTDKDILRKWAVEGRRHFYHLAFSEHSRVTGVYLSHGYDLSTVPLTEIVHNYGHGYYGISLSWGTGVHVAEMVDDLLKAGPKL
nr:hypothetical protein BaRGS_018040 [Batillaria attramentaria]